MNQKVCGFCGIDAGFMVKGANAYICQTCIETINQALTAKKIEKLSTKAVKNLTPKKIRAMLNEYVIDQEVAKEKLSVAIYNHKKMIDLKDELGDNMPVEIDKSNVIMVGPTGSGKTHIIKTLAKKLGIPLSINDATNLTAAGYVGFIRL